ncbi:hypothetical protein BDN70DRAFT_406475 [Pholiota conissans]|uniref:Uncharacterized protein n=1 Tax=Pholiota conissans TaxID=109636 RepID=A0A9P5YSY9_9AGAR|nr:hypothetical protein BDN70DRAFT_406475 [Pholiota conissans]
MLRCSSTCLRLSSCSLAPLIVVVHYNPTSSHCWCLVLSPRNSRCPIAQCHPSLLLPTHPSPGLSSIHIIFTTCSFAISALPSTHAKNYTDDRYGINSDTKAPSPRLYTDDR